MYDLCFDGDRTEAHIPMPEVTSVTCFCNEKVFIQLYVTTLPWTSVRRINIIHEHTSSWLSRVIEHLHTLPITMFFLPVKTFS